MVGEILELDHDAGESFTRRGNELVDELVIRRAAQAPLTRADIVGIVQQRFVVGADIKHDRQAELWMDAGAGGIKRQLADRNAHAVGAEVTEAEDALAVGDDDQFGLVGPVGQELGDAAAVAGCDEEAARPLEDIAEALTGEADRRGVDQRLDFIDVVAHDAEEQRFVAVVQLVQRHVFGEVVGQFAQIGHHALDLGLHRKYVRGQEAAQSKRVALLVGECGALVEQGIAQQRQAAGRVRKAEGADSRGPARSSYSSKSRAIGRLASLVVLKQRTRIRIKTEESASLCTEASNDVSIIAPFRTRSDAQRETHSALQNRMAMNRCRFSVIRGNSPDGQIAH